jgi:metal-dependent amidase/aminoacylase/carboxypeptidase family protein
MTVIILCGLATELYQHKPETGRVILLFQPAEEDGSGAKKCFQTQNLLHSTRLFALHNLPGYPKSDYSKNDTFTCAVNSIIIKLEG